MNENNEGTNIETSLVGRWYREQTNVARNGLTVHEKCVIAPGWLWLSCTTEHLCAGKRKNPREDRLNACQGTAWMRLLRKPHIRPK